MSRRQITHDWENSAHRMQVAHYDAARKFRQLHLRLGVPAVAFDVTLGLALVLPYTLGVGFDLFVLAPVSVAAAVLTGLQTFIRPSVLSERHRAAGAKYAHLKHSIELIGAFPYRTEDEFKRALLRIENEWVEIREASPTLPTSPWLNVRPAV